MPSTSAGCVRVGVGAGSRSFAWACADFEEGLGPLPGTTPRSWGLSVGLASPGGPAD